MTQSYVDLDVRPILRNGGEPFGKIMETVAALAPGQGLRLYATFKPVPLFSVLETKGFTHEAREIGGGDWEVLFHHVGTQTEDGSAPLAAAPDSVTWPEPVQHMDNRDLDPPEPMVRILSALETMETGDVLSALLRREPMFLYPQLAKRGHAWRGGFEPDGISYRIFIRAGMPPDGAA